MKANANGIKKAVSIIILAAGVVLLILAVIGLIVYSGVDSYDSNGLMALICLCGMPEIGLTIAGVRGIKQRNRHNILIAVSGFIAGIVGFVVSMASKKEFHLKITKNEIGGYVIICDNPARAEKIVSHLGNSNREIIICLEEEYSENENKKENYCYHSIADWAENFNHICCSHKIYYSCVRYQWNCVLEN